MSQITHRTNPETGNLHQIVTPQELSKMLLAAGESLDKPADWDDDDEWETA